MGVKSITQLGTLVFCACAGLLFFASATQGLSCYYCSFFQDDKEECQCRLNPSEDIKKCVDPVRFPKPDPRQSKNNHEKDSQEPRKDVDVYVLKLKMNWGSGSVELHRFSSYTTNSERFNITSKCNLDANLLTPAHNNIFCRCDTDWCNGQLFDFPDFAPTTTTTTKLPCPPTTTTTPTTTRKSTTTPGTSTTPCGPNPPTKQTTPRSVPSRAFNIRDDYFTMHKYGILCPTTFLIIGSLLLNSGIAHV